jgi:hypothetical protein
LTARIRLRRATLYPSLDPERWYHVLREHPRGVVLQLEGRELLVPWADVQTRE